MILFTQSIDAQILYRNNCKCLCLFARVDSVCMLPQTEESLLQRIVGILSARKEAQKTDREGKKEYKGYASISDYAYWASETDVSENGELYPVIEYWYEDEDFPLSIRVSHDYSRATISFAEELSLPFIYPLKKK